MRSTRGAVAAALGAFALILAVVPAPAVEAQPLPDVEVSDLSEILTGLVDCTKFCEDCLKRAKADCPAPCVYRDFDCWSFEDDGGCACSYGCLCAGNPVIV